MVELLTEKGARRVIVGDMSGIGHVKLSPGGLSGSSRRLMEASGMAGPSGRPARSSISLRRPDGMPFTRIRWPRATTGSAA